MGRCYGNPGVRLKPDTPPNPGVRLKPDTAAAAPSSP